MPYLTVLKMRSSYGEQKVSLENAEKTPNGGSVLELFDCKKYAYCHYIEVRLD